MSDSTNGRNPFLQIAGAATAPNPYTFSQWLGVFMALPTSTPAANGAPAPLDAEQAIQYVLLGLAFLQRERAAGLTGAMLSANDLIRGVSREIRLARQASKTFASLALGTYVELMGIDKR